MLSCRAAVTSAVELSRYINLEACKIVQTEIYIFLVAGEIIVITCLSSPWFCLFWKSLYVSGNVIDIWRHLAGALAILNLSVGLRAALLELICIFVDRVNFLERQFVGEVA
jgi:hypothetical protein